MMGHAKLFGVAMLVLPSLLSQSPLRKPKFMPTSEEIHTLGRDESLRESRELESV
jgi:hypothetical protein